MDRFTLGLIVLADFVVFISTSENSDMSFNISIGQNPN